MSRWRGEVLSVATVLSIPLGVAVIFPFRAVGFKAQDVALSPSATVSFVHLSEEEEAQAVRATRSALRGDGEDVRQLHADLSFSDLPDEVQGEILPVSARPLGTDVPLVECAVGPFLPSRQAPPPQRIPIVREEERPTFAKDVLLKID